MCVHSQVALLFDNGATIIFACFMSLWAVLLLEFWKRKQFTLQFKWSMLNYEEIDVCHDFGGGGVGVGKEGKTNT